MLRTALLACLFALAPAIAEAQSAPAPAPLSGPRATILEYGDSIVDQSQGLIALYWGAAHTHVKTGTSVAYTDIRGIGMTSAKASDGVTKLMPYLLADVDDLVTSTVTHGEVVAVEGFGVNDALQNVTPATFSSNVATIVAAARAHGARAVIATPTPGDCVHWSASYTISCATFNAREQALIAATNAWAAAQVPPYEVLDLWTPLSTDPNWQTSDGVHPTVSVSSPGGRAMAQLYANAFYAGQTLTWPASTDLRYTRVTSLIQEESKASTWQTRFLYTPIDGQLSLGETTAVSAERRAYKRAFTTRIVLPRRDVIWGM